jgi:glycerophosphoryl diester phosphodiesterase
MRAILLGLAMSLALTAQPGATVQASDPIVIAHRGASGYRPEHTLGGYALAIEQGADYIEPDLVLTKDGHFVARHDVYLSSTTDIASHAEFADRKRTLGGKTDWFSFDFTLAELKTLRAVQPRPSRGTEFDGKETIPTLEEIVALVKRKKAEGYKGGLYIELKRPDLFQKQMPDLENRLLTELETIADAGIPLFFQCFDPDFTVAVAARTTVPTILLIDGPADEATGWYKPEIPLAPYIGKVDGFGVYKALLINKDGSPSGLVGQVHQGGGVVHVWTIRNDQVPKMFDRVEDELRMIFGLGVDGVFADFPDTAIKVRDEFMLANKGK